jgi:anti-anti-sigma factor
MNTVETEKLTIYEVESFHKQLMQWIEGETESLKLDLGNVKLIDVPALQLLLSAQKSCAQKGIGFELSHVCEEVCKSIHNAGCSPLLKGCA